MLLLFPSGPWNSHAPGPRRQPCGRGMRPFSSQPVPSPPSQQRLQREHSIIYHEGTNVPKSMRLAKNRATAKRNLSFPLSEQIKCSPYAICSFMPANFMPPGTPSFFFVCPHLLFLVVAWETNDFTAERPGLRPSGSGGSGRR